MEAYCMLSAPMYNPLAWVTEPHTHSPGYAKPYLEVCIPWHDTVTIVHQVCDACQCSQNCTGSRLGSLKAGITKSNTLQFHCKCQTSTSKIERWLKIENYIQMLVNLSMSYLIVFRLLVSHATLPYRLDSCGCTSRCGWLQVLRLHQWVHCHTHHVLEGMSESVHQFLLVWVSPQEVSMEWVNELHQKCTTHLHAGPLHMWQIMQEIHLVMPYVSELRVEFWPCCYNCLVHVELKWHISSHVCALHQHRANCMSSDF